MTGKVREWIDICHVPYVFHTVERYFMFFFRLMMIPGQPYEHVLQSEYDTALHSRTGSLIDLKRYFGYKRFLEIGPTILFCHTCFQLLNM